MKQILTAPSQSHSRMTPGGQVGVSTMTSARRNTQILPINSGSSDILMCNGLRDQCSDLHLAGRIQPRTWMEESRIRYGSRAVRSHVRFPRVHDYTASKTVSFQFIFNSLFERQTRPKFRP